MTRLPESFHVNGAGNFEVGGPEGDNGLSGKKLVVDAYGPRVPIGGGALSGKDFFKPDRAGAILARRLAKAVVMSGAAPECTATLAIAPGDREFRIVSLAGAGAALDPRRWAGLIDLSLGKAGENMRPRRGFGNWRVTDISPRRTVSGRESSSEEILFERHVCPSAPGNAANGSHNSATSSARNPSHKLGCACLKRRIPHRRFRTESGYSVSVCFLANISLRASGRVFCIGK